MRVDFESVRQKYKPEKIKIILIAEAPPKAESIFYFENVQKGDSLFLEIMKVLYPSECFNIKSVRQRKDEFLEKFKNDGFYLIDVSDKPMGSQTKKKQIKNSLPSLIEKIRNLVSVNTKIILISSTVFDVCYRALRKEGFNVINKGPIPFPIGWQKKFRRELSELLRKYCWWTSYNAA